jgi:hypothetical protein
MHQNWILRGVLVLAASVLLTSTTVTVAQDKTSGDQPMTLTGCLISTPNPDPAGSVGKPPIYTMEVAASSPAPASGTSTASPTGKAPSSSSAAKPTVYTLSAAESIGLAKHVNHLVEVTGRLQTTQSQSTAKVPPATAGAKPAEPESKAGGAHNTFEVTALKMVSASCKQPPGQ